MVKERRINKPQDIRKLMQEQINELRTNKELDPIKKANAIGYLSNVSLSAIKDGEAYEELIKIRTMLEGMNK